MRKQAKTWVFLLALLTGIQQCYGRVELTPCKNSYTPEEQIQLGQKAVQQVYATTPVLPDASPASQYIQQLGAKLVAQAPGYKWPFNFHVANVSDINAFALPGGPIFVNLGTIQAAETEAQLAGVMAHEISHVVLQHSVCNAAKQQRVGLIAGLGQIAAGVVLGGAAGQLASEGIGMTAGLGFLKMSRGAEQQADLEGVGILYDAGYDPRGMAQFFETIQARYGKGGAQFMSDHPNPGNRTEYVDKEVASFVPRPNYITTSPAFSNLKQQVANMRAYTAKEVASGVWKTQSPNQTVSSGVNQLTTETSVSAPVNTTAASGWKKFRGSGFSIDVPANWQGYGNQSAAMFAPAGGIARSAEGGAGSVVYGMLTDRYQPQSRLPLDAALDSLVSNIAQENQGLVPGAHSNVNISGVAGHSVDCNNPSTNNGRGERDLIVAFEQRDGSLRYFVFVAPTPEFENMRTVFSQMLHTVELR